MRRIIGYTDPLEAKDVLLRGLTGLEYKGYDNAEMAYFNQNSLVRTIKKVGKVATLRKYVKSAGEISRYGIGHTRQATHGGVTDTNARPHNFGQATLTHNGIIENCHQLTQRYELEGHLASRIDNGMAAAVLDSTYREHGQDPLKVIAAFTGMLGGSYSFCILSADRPGEMYAVRKVSPLVASHTHSGALVASNLTALILYTRGYFVVPEGCIMRPTPYKIRMYNMDFNRVEPETLEVSWNTDAAMKNGYPHFMLKKIHEQPDALKNTTLPRIMDCPPDFQDDSIPDSISAECTQVRIIACDTTMYAGMVAKALMGPMLRIPVTVSVASESRYEDPLIDSKTLVMVIPQSGETTDTLATMNPAKSLGSSTLSTINVKGSTIVRESDYIFYTHAGPEIAVASTKAYSVQLAALYMIGYRMALVRGAFSRDTVREFMKGLMDVIPTTEIMIGQSEFIQSFVCRLVREEDTFFIGRGLDYAFSLEGTLKLKEVSCIHVEAYIAGELKHGTIVLIYDNMPVIAIVIQDHVSAKTISDTREVKAGGAYVILPTKKQSVAEDGVADMELRIPDPEDRFTVFPIVVAPQLVAYYTSIGKHLDVDQPRNLAKSVTVE